MKKIIYMFKEMLYLIRKYKLYFLAPLLIMLVLLAFLAFYLGPSVVISFIYAGI
ncbi:MAG: DUF5989 family protein [Candidatus Omnitrophota bacterium]|nr:DUF5989 family protein [Candidatus Omnitrophota bacterium]MDD5519064.1 DUF5989 family protein [Candidatus Omnitrophota bacterium]